MRIVTVFLSLFLVSLPVFPMSEVKTRGEILLEKTREAQEMLEEVEIGFKVRKEKTKIPKKVRSKKTGKLVTIHIEKTEEVVAARQIALVAWSPEKDTWHKILFSVSHPVPKNSFNFIVETPGYEVERVSGRSLSKLVFRVWHGGEKLVVFAGKHWWLPPELISETNYKKISDRAEGFIYTPYSEDLYDKALVRTGYEFFMGEIEKAKADLRARPVVSRSLPRKLLADAIPDDLILNIGINEQMDHSKYRRDPELTADEILIEYALNREKAFSKIVSTEGARGPFQFTNRYRKGHPGTYDIVAANYEDAELLEDFEEGTQDLPNMIKIAICLLDMELAKFSQEVHEQFEKEYRKAAIYPAACYNGGCGIGFRLYQWIKKSGYEISEDKFEVPESVFVYYRARRVKGKRIFEKKVNTETHMYLQKQAYLWGYIDKLKERQR